ncbi:MAG: glycosyltransferase family 87 protein, partial [Pseudomonadota bacterium]
SRWRYATWVDATRIRRISVMSIVVGVIATIALIATSEGALDVFGRPLGTDFSSFYTAGQLALEGRPADAYQPSEQAKIQLALFEADEIPFYVWHYPPLFLVVAAGLAMLPYALSWFAWASVTLVSYIAVVQRLFRKDTVILAAIGFPAVLINFLHGQNGFVIAALFAGALLCLRSKPLLAGVLIGLMAFKPQFGVLIPIALFAGGFYRTFAMATLTVVLTCAATVLLFGEHTWFAFFESTQATRDQVLESGGAGWHKMQSLFSAVRMWGGSILIAYIAQAVLIVSVTLATIWIWRSKIDYELKAASLMVGALLVSPYVYDYDLVLLAPAALFLIRHSLRSGFAPYEQFGLAFVWLVPILARPSALVLFVPLAFLSMLWLFALLVQKSRAQMQQGHAEAIA